MQQGVRKGIGRPSPAMVVAVVALIAALSGSAVAAIGTTSARHKFVLPKNSVGSRQIKRKAVTTGKLANNAVNGRKVANQSLTGADIKLSALGTVPSAANAANASNANTVDGHAAACPGGTILIRGYCFDAASNPPVGSVKAAADACAAKGGWLPTPLQLYSVRGVINLGTGVPPDYQYTDDYYDNTAGSGYSTVVVDGTGTITRIAVDNSARYICVYPLVR